MRSRGHADANSIVATFHRPRGVSEREQRETAGRPTSRSAVTSAPRGIGCLAASDTCCPRRGIGPSRCRLGSDRHAVRDAPVGGAACSTHQILSLDFGQIAVQSDPSCDVIGPPTLNRKGTPLERDFALATLKRVLPRLGGEADRDEGVGGEPGQDVV